MNNSSNPLNSLERVPFHFIQRRSHPNDVSLYFGGTRSQMRHNWSRHTRRRYGSLSAFRFRTRWVEPEDQISFLSFRRSRRGIEVPKVLLELSLADPSGSLTPFGTRVLVEFQTFVSRQLQISRIQLDRCVHYWNAVPSHSFYFGIAPRVYSSATSDFLTRGPSASSQSFAVTF